MARFDSAQVFNDDFNYFYADRIGAARTASEIALLQSLLELSRFHFVLDLCCGRGRIANSLTSTGIHNIVGLDIFREYVDAATDDARRAGIAARYVQGDAVHLPFRHAFDLVVCWYTSFGYFDDIENRQLLGEIHDVLQPNGTVVLDIDSKPYLLRSGLPTQLRERGRDLMVEQFTFNAELQRIEAARTIVRDDEVRRSTYFVRLFDEAEIRAWMMDAGFSIIEIHGEDGAIFSPSHRRMIVTAQTK